MARPIQNLCKNWSSELQAELAKYKTLFKPVVHAGRFKLEDIRYKNAIESEAPPNCTE